MTMPKNEKKTEYIKNLFPGLGPFSWCSSKCAPGNHHKLEYTVIDGNQKNRHRLVCYLNPSVFMGLFDM